MQYYPALSGDRETVHRRWTHYDDELVSMMFSRIVNRTALSGECAATMQQEIAKNLFDLCFYINQDVHHC